MLSENLVFIKMYSLEKHQPQKKTTMYMFTRDIFFSICYAELKQNK